MHTTYSPMISEPQAHPWWRDAVIYQVYWRSFQDSTGTGLGDLQGLISRLDYIAELGVKAIWINPFFASPGEDHGYDISDYYQLQEEAGDWADLDALMSACEARGLRVILDLVLNHSSDQHPWFQAALRGDPHYHDFYIWRAGEEGAPPTNGRSWCAPSCWSYRAELGQHYLHSFTPHQPDLNWANPACREALYDVLRFWIHRGVSGFRLDVINLIGKPERFEPVSDPSSRAHLVNQGPLLCYLKELREQVFEGRDLLIIGETPLVSPPVAQPMTRAQGGALDLIIHFELMDALPRWELDVYREVQARWAPSQSQPARCAQYLNNHDQPRAVSRFNADGEHRVMAAKLFATLTHLTPGVPLIYQGEELGMTSCLDFNINELRDPFTLSAIKERVALGEREDSVLDELLPMCRDHARTPMQWSSARHAGFTTGDPWLKVNPNYLEVNASSDRAQPWSVYRFYQALILLRSRCEGLITSDYLDHGYPSAELFVFERRSPKGSWLIIANTGPTEQRYHPELNPSFEREQRPPAQGRLLLGNLLPAPSPLWRTAEPLALAPFEVRVYQLK